MGVISIAVLSVGRWYFDEVLRGARERVEAAGHTALVHPIPLSSTSTGEAAAAIAAVERFLRDHAPVAAPAEDAVSGWVRAARHEAVSREPEPGLWS